MVCHCPPPITQSLASRTSVLIDCSKPTLWDILPGVVSTKDMAHQLHPNQVTQQRVDGGHLEQQTGSSHKHHNISAGKVIQKVLRQSKGQRSAWESMVKCHKGARNRHMWKLNSALQLTDRTKRRNEAYWLNAVFRQWWRRKRSEDHNSHIEVC